MFGWLSSGTPCPLDAPVKEWLEGRWKWILQEFGFERLKKLPMMTPSLHDFPEPYSPVPECLILLVKRIAGMMELDPNTIDIEFFNDQAGASGASRVAAGYYLPSDDGRFTIAINLTGAGDAEATIAHELAHIHLLGHGRVDSETPDHEILTDLLTVYFGFGLFSANSVVRSTTWSDSTMSYYEWRKLGYLGMQEYGYALALRILTWDDEDHYWLNHMRRDVEVAFQNSYRYLNQQNPPAALPPKGFSDITGVRLMMAGRKNGIGLERIRFVSDAIENRFKLHEDLHDWMPLTVELCCNLVEDYAVQEFDVDARITLETWGMMEGDAVGQTVNALLEAGLLQCTLEYSQHEFKNYGMLQIADCSDVPEEPESNEADAS